MTQRKVLIISLIFLGLLGGIGTYFGSLIHFAASPLKPGAQESNIIEIHRKESSHEISRELVRLGVVGDANQFHRLGRFTKQWNRIKAGEYRVSPAMTPLQVFGVITSGVSLAYPITIREGENMFEVADAIAEKQLAPKEKLVALMRDPQFIQSLGFSEPIPSTLEGYLFPDTYNLTKVMSPEEMLKLMVKRFFSVWGQNENNRAKSLGFTRHQVVTLASIIEKETGAPQERPMISSVFHNRLKKRMRLQSDPTIIYGIWENYDGNLHKSDIQEKTAYNTYQINALPPGPISNPGREAILAALHPATSDYLFFVSHNDGTHEFTSTYRDHSNAVKKFQMNRNAREGKSWRDLFKKSN